MQLTGKKILLGITGSIAAYKTPELVRLFVKQGAEVKVILTQAAKEFVTPVSLATVSKNPVVSNYIKSSDTGEWENHVALGEWADLILIAPATSNTIAKMANGLSDSILLTTFQSARHDVMVAPAMDLDMYQHPSLKRNLDTLRQDGVLILDSPEGELASGLSGKGRMLEPELIVEEVISHFNLSKKLQGKKVIITAGPTYEAIDPVRFIGNHSSGKMGLEIALAAHEEGAEVHLVIGPNHLAIPKLNNLHVHSITSALEMDEKVQEIFPKSDLGIFSAAVADYRPSNTAEHKIKKDQGGMEGINLTENPDILKRASSIKKPEQTIVGFALETQNAIENGKKKLERKKLDWIIVNSLEDSNSGFGTNTNKVTLINNKFDIFEFPLLTKKKVAIKLLETISK